MSSGQFRLQSWYNIKVDFFLKRKKSLIVFGLIIVLYFVLRLPNLTLQPIFADEAIYIRWAQVMRSEPTLRFLPLSDGKTPLFMWVMIPVFKFIQDPLLAGRLLSVFAGLFTLLGVFFLSRRTFGTRVAFWAILLYAITPYTVFFDRMALVDSMLAAFTVWVVFFAIWLVTSLRLDIAMILGGLLGGAILTKTPGFLNLLVLPVSLLLFKNKGGSHTLIKLIILWCVAIIIALGAYNILRLGPNFHLLSSRNADYVFSPFELLGRPLDPFIPHFNDIADWFPKLFTWPILFSVIIGVFYVLLGGIRQISSGQSRLEIVVLLWAFIPLLLNMAFLKTFTARYLLSSIPLLICFGGYGITKLLPRLAYIRRFPVFLMLIVVLPLTLYFNYLLLVSPDKAPLPKEERKGYLEDWTAGYGLSDIAKYLIDKSKNNKVVVGTEGFFGTLPDGLYIYLDKSNIAVVGSSATISAQIRDAVKGNLTYFVGNKNSLRGISRGIRVINMYPKATSQEGFQDATVLWQVF